MISTQIIEQKKPSNINNNLLLYGVTWEQFKSLENAFNSIVDIRLIYLDGILNIMRLSSEHEYYKRTISLLLEAYLRQKNIRFYSGGSATLGNKQITGQKEPDESYNLYEKKVIPDLLIEVIVTSGNINILEIYKRIGIPEVWFWQDGLLKIYHLQEVYHRVENSILLPDLDIKLLIKYINYYDQYDAVNEFLQEL